ELIERAVIGIACLTDGRFVSANAAFLRMLAYASLEALSDVTFAALFVDPEAHAAVIRVLHDDDDVAGDDIQWIGRDGTRIDVRLSACQIGRSGHAPGTVALY